MARVTAEEVRAVGGFPDSLNLEPFIETATMVVDEMLVPSDCGYSDARLKAVELYLSAHYASLTGDISLTGRGGLTRTKTGESEEQYAAPKGDGLSSSAWGQQALALAACGELIDMGANAKKKALFRLV